MKGLLIAGVAMLGTSVLPAQSQTMLDKLIQRIGKPKGAATAGGSYSATISPAQSASIDGLLSQPLADKGVAGDRTAAAPLIRMLLATASCAQRDGAWNGINRYRLTPKSFQADLGIYSPMSDMHYHDSAVCLDAARITDWGKPVANALAFKVYYLAADSGEASMQEYQLQRTTDGQWLIRSISYRQS